MIVVPQVVHCKRESYTMMIDRTTKWGNPYSHKSGTLAEHTVKTREESVTMYEAYITGKPLLMADLYELNNQILGCWCKPKACHGDILARLVGKYLVLPPEKLGIYPLEEAILHTPEDDPREVIILKHNQRWYYHPLSITDNHSQILEWLKAMESSLINNTPLNLYFWTQINADNTV